MARDAVAITALTLNAGVTEPAGTAINVTNGGSVAANRTDNLVIEVRNTAVGAKTVTIPAGIGPLSGQGSLVVSVPATSGVKLITVESARFIQADGTIHLDYETAMTGTAAAYRLPQGL